MKDLNRRVAVVTGAGGGIGRALCVALAKRGSNLALVDISQAALQGTADAVARTGVKVSQHVVDITDKDQMAALAQQVIDAHGKVNLLVNNAGITYQKRFDTHTLEDWDRIIGINFLGVIYGCHYFMDALKASGEGHIVNLSSMTAFAGLPTQSSYCATKAAVKALSESMRGELEKNNIGVTSVHPGAIKTDMIQATIDNSDDKAAAQRNYELANRIGTTPERTAELIVKAVEKNKLRVRVGFDSVLMDVLKRLFPVGLHRLTGKAA